MVFYKRNARILVVDDDEEFADLLAEHLSSQGYSARAAYGGDPQITQITPVK